MKPWRCIVFDCDGVLVDSVPISNRVMTGLLDRYGPPEKFAQALASFQSGSLKACLQEIEAVLKTSLPVDFEKDFRRKTFEAFKAELKPIEGIPELIDQLTIPYCVASSGPPEKIKLNLQLTGLLEKFEGRIFSSYEINSWKPDPGIFLYAASQMGFAPHECVVIEDTPHGIQAAQRGGFNVLGLVHAGNLSQLEETAVPLFSSIKELSSQLL